MHVINILGKYTENELKINVFTCLLSRFDNFGREERLTESLVGTAPGMRFLLQRTFASAMAGLKKLDSSKLIEQRAAYLLSAL